MLWFGCCLVDCVWCLCGGGGVDFVVWVWFG